MLKKAILFFACASCTLLSPSTESINQDQLLACGACKDILCCHCHGKGKTKQTTLAKCPCQDKGNEFACACFNEGPPDLTA